MGSIDRADWHSGGDFPKDVPEENGGTHIGMYLTWIIDNDLTSEFCKEEFNKGLGEVKSRIITGRDFLFEHCDGKFWNDVLNDIGQKFTEDYYTSILYYDDYVKTLDNDEETIYHIENSWKNYEKLKPILDKRFKKWKARKEKIMVEFKIAVSNQEFEIGKNLFRAYAKELGLDLAFQNFDYELENMQRQYCEPEGTLLIVYLKNSQPIGCFGIRKLDDTICELKRMYLDSKFRGRGIGKKLMEESIKIGSKLGYKKIRLDTLSTMKSAIGLYKKYGFYEIEPYRYNPIEGAIYFEKRLI